MKLYKTMRGAVIEDNGIHQLLTDNWDELINRDDLFSYLQQVTASKSVESGGGGDFLDNGLLAPLGKQEVWAAGVTYFRSRTARMEEAQTAGGADFYDRIYNAERPELFFKATPHRVAHPNGEVRIRQDSKWNVPEPELALVVTRSGRINGYTIGNDMSSRDIEGENPLYLPQAKVYDKSCALGPCILVSDEELPGTTEIKILITRQGHTAFDGTTTLSQIKRPVKLLVEYLYRDNSFPDGCVLLTGTGIIPPDSFTLHSQDEISITIDAIGTLVNRVQ